MQWLNPDAFVSAVDPGTGACYGGDSPAHCQFGDLGRNSLRGPDFVWSDLYVTRRFRLREGLTLRMDGQFFNVLNHVNYLFGQFGAISAEPTPLELGQSGFGFPLAARAPRQIQVALKFYF